MGAQLRAHARTRTGEIILDVCEMSMCGCLPVSLRCTSLRGVQTLERVYLHARLGLTVASPAHANAVNLACTETRSSFTLSLSSRLQSTMLAWRLSSLSGNLATLDTLSRRIRARYTILRIVSNLRCRSVELNQYTFFIKQKKNRKNDNNKL